MICAITAALRAVKCSTLFIVKRPHSGRGSVSMINGGNISKFRVFEITTHLPIATVCGALQRTVVVNAATTGRSSMAVWPLPSLNADDLDDALQRVKIGGITRIERQPVGRGC